MWAAQIIQCGGDPDDEFPWKNAGDLYANIDEIRHGGLAKWASYEVQYHGPLPADGPPPKWMTQKFELCLRNTRDVICQQLACRDFQGRVNFRPYQQFNKSRKRVYSNLVSGDWAWKKAVCFLTFCSDLSMTYIIFCRIKLLRTQTRMVPCSSRLSQAVTKLLPQMQLVSKNITRFYAPLETSQMRHVVRRGFLCYQPHSFQSQKVS